jgi:SAM-dependent methyltransferase
MGWWWVTDLSMREVIRKVRERVLPNVRYLPRSTIRMCRACRKRTLMVALGDGEEFHLCLRCRANLRYEMLAEYVRRTCPDMSSLDVLELDFASPLRPILSGARSYTRSFYRDGVTPGTVREDGVVCQDITRLTYPDESLDLIVSSDVLEHVPDAWAAFRESSRVLRPGGRHVFTVPPAPATVRRALIENGRIVHLVHPPEYHLDPLDRAGVLAFWQYGPDLPDRFATDGLEFRVALGPEGANGRVVWEARKR